jgi:hypothetical protein
MADADKLTPAQVDTIQTEKERKALGQRHVNIVWELRC